MVDLSSSWVCETQGRSLSDVLRIPNDEDPNENREQNGVAGPVLLSQPEESAPCVLSLNCRPPAVIAALELVSEARTAEAYDQSGEYCGTARGEPHRSKRGGAERRCREEVQRGGAERRATPERCQV